MPLVRTCDHPYFMPPCAPTAHLAPPIFGTMTEVDDFLPPPQASFRPAMAPPALPRIPAPDDTGYALPSEESAIQLWTPQPPAMAEETYDLLLNHSLQLTDLEGALRIYVVMLTEGIALVPGTSQRLVEVLTGAKAWPYLCEVLRLAREAGEAIVYMPVRHAIDAAVASGDGVAARKISEAHSGNPVPISLCHMILRRLCEDDIAAADVFMQDMVQNTQVKMDAHAYRLLLEGFVNHGDLPAADRVLNFLEANGMHRSPFPYTMLMRGYAEVGRTREVAELFDRMLRAAVKPSAVTYATAIRACADHGRLHEALHYWHEMRKAGWAPHRAAVDALLSAAIQAKNEAVARQFYGQSQAMRMNLRLWQIGGLTHLGVIRHRSASHPPRAPRLTRRAPVSRVY